MRFDVIVGNPPYQGNWDPLYMQVARSTYDNCMHQASLMVLINPMTIIENMFSGDPHFEKTRRKYSNMRLLRFIYDEAFCNSFKNVDLNGGFGIFVYSALGQYNLFSEHVKKIRYGAEWDSDRKTVEKICWARPLDLSEGFFRTHYPSVEKIRMKIREIPPGYYCLCSIHRGHFGKWDWTTFMTARNLIAQRTIPENQWNVFVFGDRESCVSFIKWMNTDLVQFVIRFFKHSSKNPKVLVERIPSPPENGDFSDCSLMKAFGLSEDEMRHIHESMEEYGWKTRDRRRFVSEFVGTEYKCPDIELDGTEERLMKFIGGLNDVN